MFAIEYQGFLFRRRANIGNDPFPQIRPGSSADRRTGGCGDMGGDEQGRVHPLSREYRSDGKAFRASPAILPLGIPVEVGVRPEWGHLTRTLLPDVMLRSPM